MEQQKTQDKIYLDFKIGPFVLGKFIIENQKAVLITNRPILAKLIYRMTPLERRKKIIYNKKDNSITENFPNLSKEEIAKRLKVDLISAQNEFKQQVGKKTKKN